MLLQAYRVAVKSTWDNACRERGPSSWETLESLLILSLDFYHSGRLITDKEETLALRPAHLSFLLTHIFQSLKGTPKGQMRIPSYQYFEVSTSPVLF